MWDSTTVPSESRARSPLVPRAQPADQEVDTSHLAAGWQQCTPSTPPRILRNASGFPQINTSAFPSLAGMVRYGQQRGAQMGFYTDNCRCHESSTATHYEQDARLTEALGFSAIKIDRHAHISQAWADE
jgi:hypothetical protein